MVPIASKIAPFNDRPSTSVHPQEKNPPTQQTLTRRAISFRPNRTPSRPSSTKPISQNRGTTPISLRGAHFEKVPLRHTKKRGKFEPISYADSA